MSQTAPATLQGPADGSPVPTLVLPRPNLGPEPWESPGASGLPAELIAGTALTIALIALVARRWRLRMKRRRRANRDSIANPADHEIPQTPRERLIASSIPVRAALIAQFGPTWSSRTTEEIDRDPTLADRVGLETSRAVVAYLARVDRAKFAAEELDDVDEWIDSAAHFTQLFPPRTTPPRPARGS